jgi:hypothetical protein
MNAKLSIKIVLALVIIFTFRAEAQEIQYEKRGGIYVEKNTTNEPQRTHHNVIYKPGKMFTFKYQYFDKFGEEFLFQKGYYGNWKFVSKYAGNDSAIYTIEMYLPLDVIDTIIPSYQSIIEYSYLDKSEKKLFRWDSRTGLIENQKNIWLHPPREYLFTILELNPFPYIEFPCKKGKTWKWELTIGSHWGDERWKIWEGNIINKYKYKIVDSECIIATELGELKCCKIKSTSKSSIGTTCLIAYFNEQYGFIRYEYVNIDKSKINMELIKVEEK